MCSPSLIRLSCGGLHRTTFSTPSNEGNAIKGDGCYLTEDISESMLWHRLEASFMPKHSACVGLHEQHNSASKSPAGAGDNEENCTFKYQTPLLLLSYRGLFRPCSFVANVHIYPQRNRLSKRDDPLAFSVAMR
jgi:hypothetical protein